MKKCKLEDIYDLSDLMYERAINGTRVYTALFYEEASALMRALLDYDDVSVFHVDIAEENCDGYNKEYYVVLDDDLSLYVEKAWADKTEHHEAGYIYFEADELYIDGAASYAIVKIQGNPKCETYELELENECFNIDMDESTEDYIKTFEDFIELIKYLFSDDEMEDQDSDDEVIHFINRRFPKDCNWRCENCYYFALILKDRFPGGDIYYDVINGHFSYKYDGKHYDHTGKFKPDGYLVKWDDFDNYDSIQKERIIRDCIK